jgi:hypothetical protein
MDADEIFRRATESIALVKKHQADLKKLKEQRNNLVQAIFKVDGLIAATEDIIETRTEIIALYTKQLKKAKSQV